MSSTKSVVIYSPKLCRHLLRKGLAITDIAPNRYNPEHTVFYFTDENNIMKEVKEFVHHNIVPEPEESLTLNS